MEEINMKLLRVKDVKKEIRNKAVKMDDKELFLSNAYNEYLSQMIKGVSMEDDELSAKMFVGNNSDTAFTDGKVTNININNPYVKGLSRQEKHDIYTGLNLHEGGHIIFTDFQLMKKSDEALKGGYLYPSVGIDEAELLDFIVKSGNDTSSIRMLYDRLDNIIEDGFVDRAVMRVAPGYAPCLQKVRELDKDMLKPYEELVAMKLPETEIFTSLVFAYAYLGIKTYNPEIKDEVIKAVEEIIPYIDAAVWEYAPMLRKISVNRVFCKLFSFFKKSVQNSANQQQNKQKEHQNNQNQQSQTQGQQAGSQGQASSIPNSAPVQQPQSQNATDNQSNNSLSTQAVNNQSQSGQSQSESANTQEGNQGPSNQDRPLSVEEIKALKDALSQAGEKAPNTEKTEHKNTSSVSPNQSVINALKNGEKQQLGASATPLPSDSKRPSQEVINLCEKAAKEKVEQEQEKAISQNLKSMREGAFDEAELHKKVSSTIARMNISSVGEVLYEQKHKTLDLILKRLLKEFEKEIKDRQTGDTMTGLYSGKAITSGELYRHDKRIMNNKILPEDIPDMAVGVIIDCSGSMGGDKINRALECAYITYQFCKQLNIPIFVLGHNVHSSVCLYSAADESSLDGNDAKGRFSLKPGGCNRDGYALWDGIKKLEKIDAEQKVLFVISDGRPNDGMYKGDTAKADLQNCVKYGVKKDILTIAAAIDDADEIKHFYKDGVSEKNSAKYLDLSHLEKLPKSFVKILKSMLD